MASSFWMAMVFVLLMNSDVSTAETVESTEASEGLKFENSINNNINSMDNQSPEVRDPPQRTNGINLAELVNLFKNNIGSLDQIQNTMVNGLFNALMNNENIRTVLLVRVLQMFSPATGSAYIKSLNLTTSCVDSWTFLGKAMLTTEYGGPLRDWTLSCKYQHYW